MTESESNQAQALESHVEKMAETAGITKNQAATLLGEARIGGGWDFIVRVGADGSASWRGQTIEQESWERMKDYAETHQVTDLWSRVSDASRRYSTQTGDGASASLNESLSANLTRMQRFEERASLSRQESETWSGQAAQVRRASAGDRARARPALLRVAVGAPGRGRTADRGCRGECASPRPRPRRIPRRCAGTPPLSLPRKYPAPAGPDPASVGGAADYEGAAGELRGGYTRETAAAHGGWAQGVRDRALCRRRAHTGRGRGGGPWRAGGDPGPT